jgi:hypothetical protein
VKHYFLKACYKKKERRNMRSYVLNYNISDERSEKEFLEYLQKRFPKNKMVIENDFKYFAFAEKNLTAAHDALMEQIDHLDLTRTDYIDLYYTREEEPDEVKRLIIFGKSSTIENNANKLNENTLAELLEFNFIKQH